MTEPIFVERVDGLTVGDIAALTGATLSDPTRADNPIPTSPRSIAPGRAI